MKEADARKLATEIAKDLFTNTDRDRAKWSEEAVIERLTRWIQVPRKVKKP